MSNEVVVVGAGPYGLSVAAHLGARGARPLVFGKTMGSWTRNMPEGMFLKSTPSASSLSAPGSATTLDDYCAAAGLQRFDEYRDAVPIASFIDYGRWFADRHGLLVDARTVTNVALASDGFEVTLSDGESRRVRSVVAASGHVAHAYVPPGLTRLTSEGPSADGPVSHSSQHSDLAVFAGRRVAVVGAGQSALESAALLHEAGADVVVLVRASQVVWGGADEPPSLVSKLRSPPSGLGPGWAHRVLCTAPQAVRHLPPAARSYLLANILGPFGSWWLRDRVDGVVDVELGARVNSARLLESGGAQLELADAKSGARTVEVDHVIAATGYRVDVGHVSYLDRELVSRVQTVRGSAYPSLSAAFESSVPGLYFTGLAAAMTFGPLLRFVYGTHFAAPRIAASAAHLVNAA